jgi:Abnormal spindle-like microcephaly-assoc'd, ASPM-SPD-2-Hydin
MRRVSDAPEVWVRFVDFGALFCLLLLEACGSGASTAGSATQATPSLESLACASTSITGAATDSCTVSVTSAAGSSGFVVSAASNNAAVTVPATVTIPTGATSVNFTANVTAVTTAQAAVLTVSAAGISETSTLQLNAATTVLSVNATSIAFGDVTVGQSATQTLKGTATGTLPVTISAVSVTGSGFTGSGISTPTTLQPGQEATLNLQFAPAAAGAATGSVVITSNGGSPTIPLTGTGEAVIAYEVQLTWNAAVSPTDPVVSYNVYRAPSGSTLYTLLNSTADTSYTDATVQDGQTYLYIIESVDAEGNASVPSNSYTAQIP